MASSSTFSSSLQHAASTNIKHLAEYQTASSGGGFETCFGQGLDLSEFGATTSPTNMTTTSASAVLLQVVQRRAFQKRRHEAEEMKLHQTIQQRALNLQNELESSRQEEEEAPTMAAPSEFETGSRRGASTSTKGNLLTSALISMHGADSFGGKKIKKKVVKSSGKQQPGAGVRRGSNRAGTSSAAAPKKATKKSKRSKHGR